MSLFVYLFTVLPLFNGVIATRSNFDLSSYLIERSNFFFILRIHHHYMKIRYTVTLLSKKLFNFNESETLASFDELLLHIACCCAS